jgi:hypothetical protein
MALAQDGEMVAKIRCRTVSGVLDYRLTTICSGCGAQRSVEVEDLPARYRFTLWRTFVSQMRCRICQSEPASVKLRDGRAEWRLVEPKLRMVPIAI